MAFVGGRALGSLYSPRAIVALPSPRVFFSNDDVPESSLERSLRRRRLPECNALGFAVPRRMREYETGKREGDLLADPGV